jgi:Cupin domain
MDRGKMTPLHSHPDSDETMYVLEGEILFHTDGADHRVSAGGLAVAPRGVPHAFLVTTEVARLLCLHTPGCCEAFYWAASEPLDAAAPATGVVDFGRVQASAAQHGGIEILGPPPFAAR